MIVYRQLTFEQAIEVVAAKGSDRLFYHCNNGLEHVKHLDVKLTNLEKCTFFIRETQEETEAHFTNERMKEYANLKPEGSS